MVERYGHWVIRWRYAVLLLTLVLAGLASLGFPLKFDADYRVFFSEDNPQLVAFDENQNTYIKDDTVLFVLAPEDGKVFTRRNLAAVQWLTEEAWQITYSIRVSSVTNFQHSYAEGDDIIVGDLIKDAKGLSDAEITHAREIALAEPLLRNGLISPAAHATGILVSIQLPGKRLDREPLEVVESVQALREKFQAKYPHITTHLTGSIIYNDAYREASQHDYETLIPLMFLITVVVLWLLLGSFFSVFSSVLVIVFSTFMAMGLTGLAGIPFTAATNGAPIIILTLAVADSVHILMTFRLALADRGKREAIVESLRINFQPVFLTSLTTIVGFLGLNFSEIPPLRDLGNIVAMGVAVAFVLSIAFLPALISLLPASPRPATAGSVRAMDRLGEFVVRRYRPLTWTMVALALAVVAFVPRNEVNDMFQEYFDETIDFRVATDFTAENLTGLQRIDYSLKSGEPGGISEPDFLQTVEAFADWYRAQPEVLQVISITDIIKRLNRNAHGDDPAFYHLPARRDLAAQYLLLYELSLPYGLDLNHRLNVDKSATRVTVVLKTLSDNDVLALEGRAQGWLADNAPASLRVHGTGISIMFANISYRNARSLLLGSIVALLSISVVLMIALRSVRFGLISLIPSLIPIAMAYGIWGMFVGRINLMLSGIALITLGIVVDNAVHFLSKYLRARREQGLDAPAAVRYAFNNVGLALWITSVVLIAGFLAMTFSPFYINANMGAMTAITIGLALITDFFLLPPLLMRWDRGPAGA
uniref:SSD domain-containing protein n=1 Tax=Candidatus Kentrum sp. DK TaxID=2126562 RepID=A0A450SD48_9GAMM|nr:MAG: hypothetical protein BECKDK2373B_GA0170837_102821 [Candidatus Kentron sp. DK]